MNHTQLILTSALLWMLVGNAAAQRTDRLINDNWKFRFSHQVQNTTTQRVDLPHTWNAQDALIGKIDYKRGIGNYTKRLFIEKQQEGKRLFLRFEGANSVCNVFVNGKHQGEHRGGYGAFIFEITDVVKYGAENELLIRVNNAEQLDVMPLVGDFNFYGGLYRDVHLLSTDLLCISPLDYASTGVYLVQENVTDKQADVKARILLSNADTQTRRTTVRLEVSDGKRIVVKKEKEVTVEAQAVNVEQSIDFSIQQPTLWNGTQRPFIYRATVTLLNGGKEIDRIEQPLGLRYYRIDSNEGFFLNGKPLPLHGVCRHQEHSEIANALRPEHHEEDTRLMLEMGVNAVRLAHYPQAAYMYDLMDRHGIVTWAEIPFVGPGGYADKGFVDQQSFKENGKEQLRELIRQHFNHPSICFWGLFNELKEWGDNPVDYVNELNQLAHQEDPTRPTTCASNQNGELNFITDVMAWNRYDGWYGASPSSLATFLDNQHKTYPNLKIGISEYGAGASIYHQQDSLVQSVPNSWWHPENWQTYYHQENWKIFSQRPYVWGTFIWNMFDFGAAHRTEGDRPGINDKGLVTYDRKTKKDAFFFYKANWNVEPMIHLAEKRITKRTSQQVDINVFSNLDEVTLMVNGKIIDRQKPDSLRTVTFRNVKLEKGTNRIETTGRWKKGELSDSNQWMLE